MAITTVIIDPSTCSSRVSNSIDLNDSGIPQQFQQHQRIFQREASVDVSHLAPLQDETPSPPAETGPFKSTRGFWFVMLSISAISLCGSVKGTIVVNALPTIVAALGDSNLYLWVLNRFFLASIAVLALYAQVSDIFSR